MRTITINKAEKLEIRSRKKWERKASYKRYVKAVRMFNEDCDKFEGKTIKIKRINQALGVYEYAGATGLNMPPQYYTMIVDEVGTLSFDINYRNTDTLEIL